MERNQLEDFLNKGYELGFTKQTDNPQYLGWILIQKRVPDDRYLSLLNPGEEPEYVRKQELFRNHPYQVRVVELNRDDFDNDRYETEKDFNLNRVHYFSNLDEVEEFVQQFGHTLTEIKWRVEISAP